MQYVHNVHMSEKARLSAAWIDSLGVAPSAAAQNAGLTHNRVLRQLKSDDGLSADVVIAIARAQKVNILKALLDTGHLHESEISAEVVTDATNRTLVRRYLDLATNQEIVEAIQKRLDEGSGDVFNEPATLPAKPVKDRPVRIVDNRGFLTPDAATYVVAADSSPIEPEPGDPDYGA